MSNRQTSIPLQSKVSLTLVLLIAAFVITSYTILRSVIAPAFDELELAAAHSDCPDSAGDLGFFARGKMVPAFEEIVFNLQPGSYSDVFETEFGWHIAKVIEKRPPIPCPLEQVRDIIVQDLTRQAEEKTLEQFLDAKKENANIEER